MDFKMIVKGLFGGREVANKSLIDNTSADKIALGKAKKVLPHKVKAVARTRQDITNWNAAFNLTIAEEPKNWLHQNLLTEACVDALLASQLQNRLQKCLARPYVLKTEKGEIDAEQTAKLKSSPATIDLHTSSWERRLYGYNLVELQATADTLIVNKIPRQNVVPQKGYFYEDYTEDTFIEYRLLKEFGKWILEFNNGDMGLINKAIPHVLFKRFAQSCWSELCELYGIPPRVLKTNTQDTAQLNRAEAMMRDMSAAAWFIIDNDENFEWAKASDTNGDVYKQLINLCNNEISLLISGAVVGQDTQNGSRSKDESGREQLQELVDSDLMQIEMDWNSIIIPALLQLGYLKGNVRFEFEKATDLNQLWTITKEALPFFNIDPEWAKNTFGVEITGERTQATAKSGKLNDDSSFFD